MVHHHKYKRDPAVVHAWLVGADIASLAAAVHLIQDAKVPGPQIHILKNSASQSHILETLPVTQALAANVDDAPGGDVYYSRILSSNYVCTNELLSQISSWKKLNQTVQK
jgi:oleate hydratase